MVKGYHLQLQYNPPSIHNFKCFNIRVATAHDPVTQKEGYDLLMISNEPLTGNACFYSNVFGVPEQTGG